MTKSHMKLQGPWSAILRKKKKAIVLNLINVHYWLYNTTYQKQGLMLPLEKSLILPALSPPDFLMVPLSGLFSDRFLCILTKISTAQILNFLGVKE